MSRNATVEQGLMAMIVTSEFLAKKKKRQTSWLSAWNAISRVSSNLGPKLPQMSALVKQELIWTHPDKLHVSSL